MLKILLAALLALLMLPARFADAGNIGLAVGSGQQFTSIAAAVAAANGDPNPANFYVISIAAGTYPNDTAIITRPMMIMAATPGALVLLNQNTDLPNQKGILEIWAPVTVDGLTFQGAHIADALGANGAAIRVEGNTGYTLTVRNSTFIGNQEGLLSDQSIPFDIVLTNNVFINNGNGNVNSLTHGVYISGGANSLTAIGNEFCGTILGHNLKSRAAISIIENNTLYDGALDPNQPRCTAGSTSYALDIPNGGAAVVFGNTMIQGNSTQNNSILAYGEEGLAYPTNSLVFINNTMQNTLGGAIGILDPSGTPVVGNGNNFAASITTPINPSSANQLTGSGNGGGGGSVSPDGTVLNAPSNANLVTAAGTWTFSATLQQTGQYVILLNGNQVSGWAALMEVAHSGQLYAFNSIYLGGSWWLWNGSGWNQVAAP